jgi:hypothetical protein
VREGDTISVNDGVIVRNLAYLLATATVRSVKKSQRLVYQSFLIPTRCSSYQLSWKVMQSPFPSRDPKQALIDAFEKTQRLLEHATDLGQVWWRID